MNGASLKKATSKLQIALLEVQQMKKETARTKLEAKQTELKFKEANMTIFKLNKSKMILRRHVRKLMDQKKN